MTDSDQLFHYGVLRRSGRYPWGSGGPEYASDRGFLGMVYSMKKQGLSDKQIADSIGSSIAELRAAKSIAKNETWKADAAQALRLQNKGMSTSAIARRMARPEPTVRNLLNPALVARRDSLTTLSNLLEGKIKDGGYLDIGPGTENHLSISATKLSTAVAALKEKGYEVRTVQIPQLGTTHKTTIKVLAPPGTGKKFIDPTEIKTIAEYSQDGGKTYTGIEPPRNISSKRVGVRYAEDGGAEADGVVYVRPGVKDVALGSARYAQVRIAVDGTHYIKGMAMYKDDLPAGHDLVFNTNKSRTSNKLDAFKSQKDEENPFGSTVRQLYYTDKSGKKHLSVMNIVNEEGNWRDWSRSLSSQVLSKQSVALAKRQLDHALALKHEAFDEIKQLTNPVVKRKLLESFADSADSAAVHLKAAALPKQGTHVILPIPGMKETEIYAPNYRNGERVALVRFPHGGTFEIPELTVNNRNKEASSALSRPVEGNAFLKAPDAVGIHPNVARRLSGADFDGDTVLVIPNKRGELETAPALAQLKTFDPKEMYAPYDGMKTIDGGTYRASTGKVDYGGKNPSGSSKQHQMGDVSNLITDMTIKGASHDEIARAVKHSMVVIDAEKHSLNYKQSYLDNGIASLKERYQGRGPTGRLAGASTIISRAGSRTYIPDRKARRASEGGAVNPKTGEKVFVPTGKTHLDAKGRVVVDTVQVSRLSKAMDARELVSSPHGMPIENVYASHSNSLKALANEARKESLRAGKLEYSPTANKVYAKEVSKLNADLNIALKNKPLERQAQIVANAMSAAIRKENPHMDPGDLRKLKGRALDTARKRVGAQKQLIDITDAQWKAIQSGAISPDRLRRILDHADLDKVKKLATPRTATVMTPAKMAIAKARLASGYSQAEVADSLGIPVSTLNTALKREGG